MKKMTLTEVQDCLLSVMKIFHSFCMENGLSYYMIGGTLLGAIRHRGFIPWDDDIDVGMTRDQYEAFLRVSESFPAPYEVRNYRNTANCDYVLTRIWIPNTQIDNPSQKYAKVDKRLYFDIFPLDSVPANDRESENKVRSVAAKKRLLYYTDVHDFENSSAALIVKKALSAFLSPFRNKTLASLDKVMAYPRVIDSDCICSFASQYSFKKQKMKREVYGTPSLYDFCGNRFYGPEQFDAYLTQLYGADYMELPPPEKRRKGYDVYDTLAE